jgi:hypothetical protein
MLSQRFCNLLVTRRAKWNGQSYRICSEPRVMTLVPQASPSLSKAQESVNAFFEIYGCSRWPWVGQPCSRSNSWSRMHAVTPRPVRPSSTTYLLLVPVSLICTVVTSREHTADSVPAWIREAPVSNPRMETSYSDVFRAWTLSRTVWSRVLLDKLIVAQLVKQFPASCRSCSLQHPNVYEARTFVTAACRCVVSSRA